MTVSTQQKKTEARVGLASNVVGLTAGLAATAAAARNRALKDPVQENAGPATSRLTRYVKTPRGRARLIRAGAVGALGLQVVNTAGDVVANRVLQREAKLKRKTTKGTAVKSYEAPVDFSKAQVRGTGHGVNIEKRDVSGRDAAIAAGAGAGAGGIASVYAIPYVHRATMGGVNALADRARNKGGMALRAAKFISKRPKLIYGATLAPYAAIPAATAVAATATVRRRKKAVVASKRYFDSEADRQRRLGAYAGLGGGSALVLGDAARRQFKVSTERDKPVAGKTRGRLKRLEVGLKEGKRLRTPVLLGGAAALSAIGGAAAYKHGISERNRPYS